MVCSERHEQLVRYLEGVGFDVRAFRSPLGAPREGTLVWLTNQNTDDRRIISMVQVWLGAKTKLRAIIVTDRPVRLRDAAADEPYGRLVILPAPVFGWHLVDSLRDGTFAVS